MRARLHARNSRTRSPAGQKARRYVATSVLAVFVSEVGLFALYVGFHWTAKWANVGAAVVGGVPSYYLNRTWTWGKTGRSHLMKEVLPFWGLALLGLGVSTWAVDFSEVRARQFTDSRLGQAVFINVVLIATFGVVWVTKFVVFNRVMFVQEEMRTELDDLTA